MRRKYFLGILLLGLLAACGTGPAKGVDNAAATKIVATFMAQITQTAAAITPAAPAATETEVPAATDTPLVSPTPDSMMQLLGRFRTVTVSQGNLFVRDGTGVPVQITKSGKDHDPVISADGKKIAFYRGKFDHIFVINADGTNEKELVNSKNVPELANGTLKFLTFISKTNDLLFSTYFCKNNVCQSNIFISIAQLDGGVSQIISGLAPSAGNDPNFSVTPDGGYIAIVRPEHMDLYNRGNEPIYGNIVNVAPSKDGLPLQYWLPDSSELIVVAPMSNHYVVWRYSFQENRAEQLSISFPINMDCHFSVSPDRNWIFYQQSEKDYDLGSLKDAKNTAHVWDLGCVTQWSPDSQHFASQTAIGSVDGTPPITLDGHFIAWLDATHYLFTKGKSILDLQTYIAEVGKESAAVPTNFIWSSVVAVVEPRP